MLTEAQKAVIAANAARDQVLAGFRDRKDSLIRIFDRYARKVDNETATTDEALIGASLLFVLTEVYREAE